MSFINLFKLVENFLCFILDMDFKLFKLSILCLSPTPRMGCEVSAKDEELTAAKKEVMTSKGALLL